MRSTLIITAVLAFIMAGCSSKAVDYDPAKTVAFDKERDQVEHLSGPGTGGGKKSGKGLNAK